MSGYCEDCGNKLCICSEIPNCSACGEKGHIICGIIGKDYRDDRIKELKQRIAELEKSIDEEEVESAQNYLKYSSELKKNKELEQKLAEALIANEMNTEIYKEALEVIRFYESITLEKLTKEDCYTLSYDKFKYGKRAREFLKKHGMEKV